MIPTTVNITALTFTEEQLPSLTYKLDYDKQTILGTCDKLVAMRQTIYSILHTERYEHLIYSWNYGFETNDLYGKDVNLMMSLLKDRITEALLVDNRISSVTDFSVEAEKGKTKMLFTVTTTEGDIESEVEYDV